MPLTLELPEQLEENLKQEAQKEGVPATEHAAFLLSILTALLQETETTSFRNAVRIFFAHHSLDAEHVASVFEELVEQVLQEEGKASSASQKAFDNAVSRQVYENLRAWRDWHVHQPLDESHETVPLPSPPLRQRVQKRKRSDKKQTAMGKYSHVPGSSEDFAREKQEEIAREDRQGSESRP